MAIQCTLCGTVLKDNARFCNICGTLVPSHSLDPKSNALPQLASEQTDHSEGSVRVPATQQPPSRTTGSTLPDQPPAWMHQLENGVHASVPSNNVRGRQKPFPPVSGSDRNVPQLAFPTQVPEIQTISPARELRIKVWEEDQPTNMTDQAAGSQVNQKQRPGDDDEVENLPTRPLVAQSPGMVKPQQPLNTRSQKDQVAISENVDQLDTVPMITHSRVKPNSMSQPIVNEQQRHPWHQQDDFHGRATVQQQSRTALSTASPPTSPQPQRTSDSFDSFILDNQVSPSVVSTHNLRQTPPLVAVPPTGRPKKRKSRKLMTIVLVALLLLIVGGGLATWLVLYQPFTVAGVTQPQQTFSNTQIGVSLQYPRGWTASVETQKSTVHLADSSQTARFSIVFKPTSGGDVNKSLQQEATQLTLTALKPGAAQSFAGTSWQQLQGNVLINGATYTETLFASVHQQKFYTIMQLAPQTTYVQEERFVFSAMRSSFQFVP